MNSVLEVRSLEKTYPKFKLENISFSLKEGCITGFIGVNGAGKTTTLKSILGLNNIDSGDILFWGKNLNENSAEIKNSIGVVLGENCFYENLTISEMKSIIAPAYSSWSESEFKDFMDKFSLDCKQKISTLSKGMKMKVALAIALSHEAELLIMDEPTSGLDPKIRKQLMDILLEFMKKGSNRSIFFSTHITSDLDRVADELILIDEGKLIFNREKDELLQTHKIVKGKMKYLDEIDRECLKGIQITDFGFKALTTNIDALQAKTKGIVFENSTIEDIMLAYITGGSK